MTAYFGPERRESERRVNPHKTFPGPYHGPDRRVSEDRRQEATAQIVVGLTAEQMLLLKELFQTVEDMSC